MNSLTRICHGVTPGRRHGGADAISFANAIEEAMLEVKKGVPERISGELQVIFDERRAG